MIGFYTRDFRAADVIAATDYMVLICLNADLPGELGRAQAAVCHEALRELVLETREFAALLGDMYTDGTRARGAIERRERLLGLPDRPGFLREVTQQAASVADTNGRATDAVLLYHLAEEYNSVMVVANRAMSDNLAVDPGVEPKALEPLRPRPAAPDRQRSGAADALPPGSSLSLAGVDNPFVLGKHFSELYFEHAQYATRVEEMQRFTTVFLLHLWDIRRAYSEKRWEWMIVVRAHRGLSPCKACTLSISLTGIFIETRRVQHPSAARRRLHRDDPPRRAADPVRAPVRRPPRGPHPVLGSDRHQQAARPGAGADRGRRSPLRHAGPHAAAEPAGADGQGPDGVRGPPEVAHAEIVLGGHRERGSRVRNVLMVSKSSGAVEDAAIGACVERAVEH